MAAGAQIASATIKNITTNYHSYRVRGCQRPIILGEVSMNLMTGAAIRWRWVGDTLFNLIRLDTRSNSSRETFAGVTSST
jgi:hypothetical protein